MSKTLKDLTIKDNFMFGAVMMEEDNCKELLELILQIQIERIEVSKEKNIVYHPNIVILLQISVLRIYL